MLGLEQFLRTIIEKVFAGSLTGVRILLVIVSVTGEREVSFGDEVICLANAQCFDPGR